MDNGQANEVESGEVLKTSGAESLRSKSVEWSQEQKIIAVKKAIAHAINGLNDFCPQCREFDLAFTKLQEAAFWATKAIANPQ